MKKKELENFKTSIMFLFVGVYGCLLDIINGAKNLLPEFFSFVLFPKGKFDFFIHKEEVTISSSFIMFLALGSMLLATTMSNDKARYTFKGYIKIIVLKIKLKYYTGILEKELWLINKL